MVGIGSFLKIGKMAGDAICGSARELPVHVALRARHVNVRPGQSKAGGTVIEAGCRPTGSSVAQLASLRESGLHVIGIGGLLEIGRVTRCAVGGRAGEVPVDVTERTGNGGMCSGQRKTRGIVVKSCVAPAHRVMARGTGLSEPNLGVVGISSFLKISKMAGNASGGRAGEVSVDVALRASNVGVRPR